MYTYRVQTHEQTDPLPRCATHLPWNEMEQKKVRFKRNWCGSSASPSYTEKKDFDWWKNSHRIAHHISIGNHFILLCKIGGKNWQNSQNDEIIQFYKPVWRAISSQCLAASNGIHYYHSLIKCKQIVRLRNFNSSRNGANRCTVVATHAEEKCEMEIAVVSLDHNRLTQTRACVCLVRQPGEQFRMQNCKYAIIV